MAEHEVSLGEVSRDVADLRADVAAVRIAVSALPTVDRLDSTTHVWETALAATERVAELRLALAQATLEGQIDANRTHLEKLEAWQTWALRIIIGAVIASVIAVVLAAPGPIGQ